MFPALIVIIIMIVIFIYESRKIETKLTQYYVLRRPDGKYVVSISSNPDEGKCEFLVLRYDKRIELTFAAFASEFTELDNAKKFGQLYLDQDPRRFTLVSI